MSPRSIPVSPPHLAALPQAFETASRAYSVAMCAAGGGLVHQEPDFTLTILPDAHGLSGVVSPQFTAENVEDRIEAVLAAARPCRAEFRFKLGPSTQPEDLASRLERRGIRRSASLKYMGLDLSGGLPSPGGGSNPPETGVSPTPPETNLPPGVRIYPLEDFSQFLEMPHPFYGKKSSPRKRVVTAAFERLAQETPRRLWVFAAEHYGHFAGAGVMFVHASVVIGFDFAILQSLRRQGLGSALIARMGECAIQNGARWAVLASSTMGLKFYPTLGFVPIGRYPTFKVTPAML